MTLQLHPTLPNALRCRRCDGVEEVPAGPMDAGFLLAVLGGLEAKHRECVPVERFTLTPRGAEAIECHCPWTRDNYPSERAGTNPLCPRHGDARDTSIAPVTNGRQGRS